MADHVTVCDYLEGPETLRRRELEFGVVREPPAPFYDHQAVITRVVVLLDAHVRARQLGEVVASPIDVVLDAEKDLVLQPDVVYISRARRAIVRKQIWGAPDLVVEVLSAGTAHRDRTKKLGWYRHYGVRECWLVDPASGRVEVHVFAPPERPRAASGHRRIRSAVLPDLQIRADSIIER